MLLHMGTHTYTCITPDIYLKCMKHTLNIYTYICVHPYSSYQTLKRRTKKDKGSTLMNDHEINSKEKGTPSVFAYMQVKLRKI